MTYPDRVIFNADGTVDYIAVDDVWVLTHKPNTLLLSSDKAQIVVSEDATEVAIITIQLRTPKLIDGSYNNLSDSKAITLLIDDQIVSIDLVAGVGTIEIGAVFAKTITVRGESNDGNIITIEAV